VGGRARALRPAAVSDVRLSVSRAGNERRLVASWQQHVVSVVSHSLTHSLDCPCKQTDSKRLYYITAVSNNTQQHAISSAAALPVVDQRTTAAIHTALHRARC